MAKTKCSTLTTLPRVLLSTTDIRTSQMIRVDLENPDPEIESLQVLKAPHASVNRLRNDRRRCSSSGVSILCRYNRCLIRLFSCRNMTEAGAPPRISFRSESRSTEPIRPYGTITQTQLTHDSCRTFHGPTVGASRRTALNPGPQGLPFHGSR